MNAQTTGNVMLHYWDDHKNQLEKRHIWDLIKDLHDGDSPDLMGQAVGEAPCVGKRCAEWKKRRAAGKKEVTGRKPKELGAQGNANNGPNTRGGRKRRKGAQNKLDPK
jgi:hypothetical protein